MRRIARRLSRFFLAVCVVLCAAVGVVWVRGYWARDTVWLSAGQGRPLVGLASQRGTVSLIVHERFGWPAGFRLRLGEDAYLPPRVAMHHRRGEPRWHRAGLAVQRSYAYRSWLVAAPVWLVMFAAAAPLFPRAIAAARRRARAKGGRCPACGYDLRAHAAGGRCPECGAGIG